MFQSPPTSYTSNRQWIVLLHTISIHTISIQHLYNIHTYNIYTIYIHTTSISISRQYLYRKCSSHHQPAIHPAFSAACNFMRCAEAASWYSESFTSTSRLSWEVMEISREKPTCNVYTYIVYIPTCNLYI